MIRTIDKISDIVFCAEDIDVLQYSPFIRSYRHENGRDLNGFLLSIRGGCTFTFGEREVRMEEGGMIYLPRASHHAFCVDEGEALYLRIDFSLIQKGNGEEILFADVPTLFFEKTPSSVMGRAEELLFLFERGVGAESSLKKQAGLLSLFAEIQENLAPKREIELLRPALDALFLSYREEISSEELAALCSISTTHFRRLFRRLYGTTPTDYRNRLRIERAKRLLRMGGFSVGEVAEEVGFESIFYFSRVFKAQTGESPLSFARK